MTIPCFSVAQLTTGMLLLLPLAAVLCFAGRKVSCTARDRLHAWPGVTVQPL